MKVKQACKQKIFASKEIRIVLLEMYNPISIARSEQPDQE